MAIKFTSTPDRPVEPKTGRLSKKKSQTKADSNPELDLNTDGK